MSATQIRGSESATNWTNHIKWEIYDHVMSEKLRVKARFCKSINIYLEVIESTTMKDFFMMNLWRIIVTCHVSN
ncbi:hypothetical protein A0H76_2509 [Hepatospora eriocheir]|uniref:Uncharacterized protein n=1 Tax=Hepatospora eriocheir TaxID=1081669 RepID=A0A1X0QF78_9MICR|nr:hypothetical protein A0H76_2509 [Hepatospora eriocheir]